MGLLLGLLLLSVSSPLVLWAGELPLLPYISTCLQEMPAPAPLAQGTWVLFCAGFVLSSKAEPRTGH